MKCAALCDRVEKATVFVHLTREGEDKALWFPWWPISRADWGQSLFTPCLPGLVSSCKVCLDSYSGLILAGLHPTARTTVGDVLTVAHKNSHPLSKIPYKAIMLLGCDLRAGKAPKLQRMNSALLMVLQHRAVSASDLSWVAHAKFKSPREPPPSGSLWWFVLRPQVPSGRTMLYL